MSWYFVMCYRHDRIVLVQAENDLSLNYPILSHPIFCPGTKERPLLKKIVEKGIITSFVLDHVRVDRFGEMCLNK